MQDLNRSYELCELLRRCIGMQDFPRIIHICHYVLETEYLGGAMVEFGGHVGHTAKLMLAISERPLHMYESFMGLPESGKMKVTFEQMMDNFIGCQKPIVHAGWFKDLTAEDIPDRISLAHIDCDVYSSITEALTLVYGRMVRGGVILIDDYEHPEWEEVKTATDDFFRDKPEPCVMLGSIGNVGTKVCVTKQ